MIAAWATPDRLGVMDDAELEATFESICQQFDSPAAEDPATHRDLMDTRQALSEEMRRRKGQAS